MVEPHLQAIQILHNPEDRNNIKQLTSVTRFSTLHFSRYIWIMHLLNTQGKRFLLQMHLVRGRMLNKFMEGLTYDILQIPLVLK